MYTDLYIYIYGGIYNAKVYYRIILYYYKIYLYKYIYMPGYRIYIYRCEYSHTIYSISIRYTYIGISNFPSI